MSTPLRISVNGATGRMGRAVALLCQRATDLELVGACAAPEDPHLGQDVGLLAGAGSAGVEIGDDADAAMLGADVVIDFSLPPALERLARLAARRGVALVSGTTGVDDTSCLDAAAAQIPVLWAPNMSLGIQVLCQLVTEAVEKLGPEFDVEITDVHHNRKVDAPSGTALRIADAVRAARPLETVSGRHGIVGARRAAELGVFGLRGGDVIGDHTVHLLGLGERLELTHRATNRDLFARGALRAARWLVGRSPGRYQLSDVLNG